MVGGYFVKCSLPPCVEWANGVFEVFTLEACRAKVEDRDLLTLMGTYAAIAMGGDEDAIVGVDVGRDALLEIVNQEADVAQRVVVAATGSPYDGNV